jgi:hypothetical protein
VFDDLIRRTNCSSRSINVAPTASVSGPSSGVRGQARTFTLTAADVSSADQRRGFTYIINWATAPRSEVKGAVGPAGGPRLPRRGGLHRDGHGRRQGRGNQRPPVTSAITVARVELQANVPRPVRRDDRERQHRDQTHATATGNLAVSVNGASLGTFKPTGRIVVYAQSGNDTVQLQSLTVNKKNDLPGGRVGLPVRRGRRRHAGRAGAAATDNVLSGGGGADTLWGGGDDLAGRPGGRRPARRRRRRRP